MRARHNPWHNVFAFLLLASSTLVLVIVLLATRHYYDGFGTAGRALAWAVIVGGVVGIASLAIMLLRLYVRPALADGRRRLMPKRQRR